MKREAMYRAGSRAGAELVAMLSGTVAKVAQWPECTGGHLQACSHGDNSGGRGYADSDDNGLSGGTNRDKQLTCERERRGQVRRHRSLCSLHPPPQHRRCPLPPSLHLSLFLHFFISSVLSFPFRFSANHLLRFTFALQQHTHTHPSLSSLTLACGFNF